MKYKNNIIAVLLLVLPLTACCGGDIALNKINKFITEQVVDKKDPTWKTKLTKPPLLTFTEGKDYFWELKTNQGNITIKLLTDTAPMHVSSTIYLTKLGFYNDLTFHRVIPGFMAQGGDPTGTGSGNPGYKYNGEFDDKATHDTAGTLSMANAGAGTDGSQFFLTFTPTPFLDGKHTVFGKIISGSEQSLTNIENLGSRSGKTKEPIIINNASIRVADSQ
ncbi:peptidylprolyl isomerase [Colwellia echini]|uniref:Peptidyl-prolyl cis-trans isomerase n=1 Tax=Colwellia echini TaxID=1982103 RepID=A0ABY3MVM6_9GAMM|nr:peptidylprolyl isomerase [Colwellia echini]TYK65142.1 peptidylprolyl isomerase [Colwellia echini]